MKTYGVEEAIVVGGVGGALLGGAVMLCDYVLSEYIITDEFKNAAKAGVLTAEDVCDELMREGGHLDDLNERLDHQRVSFSDKDGCLNVIRVGPKP